MNNNNTLEHKSLVFAGEIVNLYRELMVKQNKTIISKQILKSGTSIGANINEANYAQSRMDFISKMHIALKETAETDYWLQLLHFSQLIDTSTYNELSFKCIEIKKLLIASIKTAKSKIDAD